jgi:hypothetical protein
MAQYRSNPHKYCSSYSTKDSSAMEDDVDESEGPPVGPELQQQFLEFTQFQNVSDLVYEVVSHAQDELITSPQYERMRHLLDGFEDGLIRAGVMQGERVENPETGETSFQGDKLFELWLTWKIAALCCITPEK